MRQFRASIGAAFIRGVAILLPAYIVWVVLEWVISKFADAAHPTAFLVQVWTGLPVAAADSIGFLVSLAVVVLVGYGSKTRPGIFAIDAINRIAFKKIPGYEVIHMVAERFFGNRETSLDIPPASRVVLFQPFDGYALCIGFVTREFSNRSFVLWPFSPVPTGRILIIENKHLIPTNLTMVEAMKIIMSFGSGATDEICRKIELALGSHKNSS